MTIQPDAFKSIWLLVVFWTIEPLAIQSFESIESQWHYSNVLKIDVEPNGDMIHPQSNDLVPKLHLNRNSFEILIQTHSASVPFKTPVFEWKASEIFLVCLSTDMEFATKRFPIELLNRFDKQTNHHWNCLHQKIQLELS